MSKLDIVIAPAPVLKQVASNVSEVNDNIRKLMDDMLETMYASNGVGLAAPQIGVSKRVVVIDVSSEKNSPMFLVNPVIKYKSKETAIEEEGCLSIPEQYSDVERAREVEVEYLDYNGDKQIVKASDDLLTICLQHEIDHLNGVLFYDHISSLRKNIMLRKLKKLKK